METVDRRLTMAPWAEYLRISAMTGRSVHKICDMVDAAAERRASHITTSQLNKLLTDMREFGHTVRSVIWSMPRPSVARAISPLLS